MGKTTVATALAKGTVDSVARELVETLRTGLYGAEPQLVLVFASPEQPLSSLAPLVAKQFPTATLLGASTAGEFTESRVEKNSTAAIAVAGDYRICAGMGCGLKTNPEAAVASALNGLPTELRGYPYRTALLLLDPLAGNGEEAALIAASMLGEKVALAGGAAGDNLRMIATEVACGAEARGDALVIGLIYSKSPLAIGVRHAHRPLSPPLRVTKAEGAIVYEVEGRPAFDVWREQTKEHAKSVGIDVYAMPAEDEGGYFLCYEAGLSTGSEYKMRAPLSRNADGSINFACGIAEGAVIRITESDAPRQIDSAFQAARIARDKLSGKKVAGAIVFDCICRNLILGAQFETATSGISKELGGVPIAGFETYGEIALDAGDMSGFHNTTSVVLAFPAGE